MGAYCNGDNGCCCPTGQVCEAFVSGVGGDSECKSKIAPPMDNPILNRAKFRNFEGSPDWGGFADNTEEFYQWSNDSANDKYLQGNPYAYARNNSSLEWNNATGQYNEHQGYMNAAGCPGYCDPPLVMGSNCNCVSGSTGRRGPLDRFPVSNGWRNAGGNPSINVGGETFDMQPTLAWNQNDFFGQPQGFGSSQTSCSPCPQGFQGDRQSCGGTGCYNSLGQRMYESGTGIPEGMGVQYTQV